MRDRAVNFITRFYLLLIFLFLYSPIAVLMVLSFNDSRSRVVWGGFTLRWYERMFTSSHITDALVTTLALAFFASLLAVLIGFPASFGICMLRRSGRSVMMTLVNIPLLDADIVTGISMMLFFMRFMELSFSSVLIAHTVFCIPYVILALMPRVEAVDWTPYESALDLGATQPYAFLRMVMPQLYSGIISGFFMSLTMSMDDFAITYFTKGAGVNTLSTMIYGEIRKGIKPELYALSTVIFMAVLILLLAVNVATRKKGGETGEGRAY